MSFRDALRDFIRANLIETGTQLDIGDDEPLIRKGIVDSMGILQLTHFIEEETGVRIPDREVQLENFQSISAMERMVQRLTAKSKPYRDLD